MPGKVSPPGGKLWHTPASNPRSQGPRQPGMRNEHAIPAPVSPAFRSDLPRGGTRVAANKKPHPTAVL
jgi:hypothetical protein